MATDSPSLSKKSHNFVWTPKGCSVDAVSVMLFSHFFIHLILCVCGGVYMCVCAYVLVCVCVKVG